MTYLDKFLKYFVFGFSLLMAIGYWFLKDPSHAIPWSLAFLLSIGKLNLYDR